MEYPFFQTRSENLKVEINCKVMRNYRFDVLINNLVWV